MGAAFFRRCRRTITVDDADVEVLFLVKLRHRARENGIKAPMGFKAPKGPIDSCVVDLRSPIFVLQRWAALSTDTRVTTVSECS